MKKALIERLFKAGRRKKTPFFTIYTLKTNPPRSISGRGSTPKEAAPQIVVVVSSRVSKLATKRNLIKRRLSEAFRRLTPKLEPELKIAVVAHHQTMGKSYQELEAALKAALNI